MSPQAVTSALSPWGASSLSRRVRGAAGQQDARPPPFPLLRSPSFTDSLSFQLGAGVSLPGMVAAKCGAEVLLSDSEELPQCLENCRRSCLMNALPHVPVLGITWGRMCPQLLALPPVDVILGSDVFFDPKGRVTLSGGFGLRQTARTSPFQTLS